MTPPIVVERHVAAAASLVYEYLTDSDKWVRWQGVDATIESRPGGLFAVTMPNGMRARGQFVELVPGRRVVFTWGWIDHSGLPPGTSTVEIDLIPDDPGTLVRLTHHGLPPDEVEVHTAGWIRYVARLALVSEGGEPAPDGT